MYFISYSDCQHNFPHRSFTETGKQVMWTKHDFYVTWMVLAFLKRNKLVDMRSSAPPPFARVIRRSHVCFKTLKVFLPPKTDLIIQQACSGLFNGIWDKVHALQFKSKKLLPAWGQRSTLLEKFSSQKKERKSKERSFKYLICILWLQIHGKHQNINGHIVINA